MSFSPWEPSETHVKPERKRPLLALLLVVIVAAVIGLFAVNNWGLPSALPFSPGGSAASTETPQRASGVGGPQPPSSTPALAVAPSDTPLAATPTATLTPLPAALRSLQVLDDAVVPARDPYSLTARLKLKGESGLARTTDRPPGNFEVGHKDVFNVSDIQNRNYYTITATVRKVTEHAYWYVQDKENVNMLALSNLADAFETRIYPKNRSVFGSEWTPGVDNDPRITVLFAPLRGAGGSYSAADEQTRAVNPFSNEREMIYISTGGGWAGLEGTLAHEFQHMIHWNEHPNQDIWLNEGSAVLAAAINGYDVLGVDTSFMNSPNVQLNSWEPNPSQARPNYGAAYMFLDYLMEHYGGEKIIRDIIAAPEPDMSAIDTALSGLGYTDRFEDAVKKWTLANLLDGQPGVGPEYTYSERQVNVEPQVTFDHYPNGYSGQASQFGASYIQLDAPKDSDGKLHIDFEGQNETPLVPTTAHSGSAIWWSNRGDLADSTMTRLFDLAGLASATLDCYLWFDIEPDFDYAYAEASTDGGASWVTLKGQYTTTTNPNGTNYGNAYTGKSEDKSGSDAEGWVHERFDLTPFAGKQVMLRFEYITDDGYNVQGLAVDDISIPELGYKDDAESDGGWQAQGFVRVDNKVHQSYYLAAVLFKSDGVDIRPVEVSQNGEASFDIEGLGADGLYSKAVLVVVGLTPHNIQHPTYQVSVRPAK